MEISTWERDKLYMALCCQLAALGGKYTMTNPNVGAVIVHDDNIIGQGWHQKFGGPHAEINALLSVKKEKRHLLPESTMYVSLEPCNHTGKTGPCTHAILDAGVKKIIIGASDPNLSVSGKGIEYLRAHQCDVKLLNDPTASEILRPFVVHQLKRPYIILKWAQSADGYIGIEGTNTWLSHDRTSILSHKWRSEVDGILIGSRTALIDKPSLSTRQYVGPNAIRIILDRSAQAYKNLHKGIKTYVINETLELDTEDFHFYKVKDSYRLDEVLSLLFSKGIYFLLVEGGAKVLNSFIHQNLWDEARVIETSLSLHNGIPAPSIKGSLQEDYQIATDRIKIYRP
jgi:diaminohydroxyphosphoribosylaminopyrimidine deaminase/5-amino-6-(5-phosphoribosylamino)uracil reductase